MNSRESASLDRYITGNYGEDQFRDEEDEHYTGPECANCHHPLASHSSEDMPYTCWEYDCECEGFSYVKKEQG